MEKRKGNGLGTTQREYNDWGNTKGMEWLGKHKGNGMGEETQREYNGWGNRKGVELMGKHKENIMDSGNKGNKMDGGTRRE